MNKSKYSNLITNTMLFALNSVATKFIVFILVPLYTTYMSAAEYGLADMSTSVIQLVTPLATLSIADASLRYMVDNEENRGVYAFIGFGVTVLSIILVSICTPLLRLDFFGGLGLYSKWFVLAYSANALMSYCGNVSRGLNKIRVIPICAGISSFVTMLLALILIGRYRLSIIGYFISVSIGPMISVVIYCLYGRVFKAIREGYDTIRYKIGKDNTFIDTLKLMLSYSLPLVPNSLFWWASTGINRFFITGMIGIAASGLYAAASKIPTLINASYAVFQQAWQLSSFQEAKKDDIVDFYEKIFSLVQGGITILSSLICHFAPLLGSVLLRGEAYESWPLIGLLVFANLMNVLNTFYGTIYTSTMKTNYIMKTTVYGSATCTMLTPILIPSLGISGACLASIAGQTIVFIIRVKQSKTLIDFDPNWHLLAPTLAMLLVQSIFVSYRVHDWELISAICLIVIILLQIVNMKSLVDNSQLGT